MLGSLHIFFQNESHDHSRGLMTSSLVLLIIKYIDNSELVKNDKAACEAAVSFSFSCVEMERVSEQAGERSSASGVRKELWRSGTKRNHLPSPAPHLSHSLAVSLPSRALIFSATHAKFSLATARKYQFISSVILF